MAEKTFPQAHGSLLDVECILYPGMTQQYHVIMTQIPSGYAYEILLKYEDEEVVKSFTPSRPEEILEMDDEPTEIKLKAQKLISDGMKFNSLKKKIGDVDKLIEKNQNIGIIKWIAADAMNELAEQRR